MSRESDGLKPPKSSSGAVPTPLIVLVVARQYDETVRTLLPVKRATATFGLPTMPVLPHNEHVFTPVTSWLSPGTRDTPFGR
jgi:hypothetical protein